MRTEDGHFRFPVAGRLSETGLGMTCAVSLELMYRILRLWKGMPYAQ
ncbi:MAG: hypothetical protein NZ742_03225 [Acidobacteria bacterium]|nr:hypothetical protein [Acidobacteriota bacterium]MDW7983958.1 hypothetical protein [Acidobacteriota bacterium]